MKKRKATNKVSKNIQVGALVEDFNSKVDFIAEQVVGQTGHITKLEAKMDHMSENIEIIKVNIEFVKDSLKQKVDVDEFATLERRVSVLESRR